MYKHFSKYFDDQMKDEPGGTCSTQGKIRNGYIKFRKPEGERSLGRWDDNIKMNLKRECGRRCGNWLSIRSSGRLL
jgi:hypothetical protein